MKTWDIDDKVDAAYEMRMEQVNHTIRTGGVATGGITVRDYFAAAALRAMSASPGCDDCAEDKISKMLAKSAYSRADAMMHERDRKQPEPCSVEEAFGL